MPSCTVHEDDDLLNKGANLCCQIAADVALHHVDEACCVHVDEVVLHLALFEVSLSLCCWLELCDWIDAHAA